MKIQVLSDREAVALADEPRWVREAIALPFVKRFFALVGTLGFFLRRPRAFGQAWVNGAREIPNPLVAMAASASLFTVALTEARRFFGKDSASGLPMTIAEAVGPYAMYLVLGMTAHVALRLLGSQRRIGTSVGMTLLTGALPGGVYTLVISGSLLFLGAFYPKTATGDDSGTPMWAKLALVIVVIGTYLYFLVLFQLALAGAHGVARWKGVIAGIFAIVVTGFVLGATHRVPALEKYADKLGPRLSLQMPERGHIVPRMNFEL